jgi:prepilin-type processing-associated H-X9-DG protein
MIYILKKFLVGALIRDNTKVNIAFVDGRLDMLAETGVAHKPT